MLLFFCCEWKHFFVFYCIHMYMYIHVHIQMYMYTVCVCASSLTYYQSQIPPIQRCRHYMVVMSIGPKYPTINTSIVNGDVQGAMEVGCHDDFLCRSIHGRGVDFRLFSLFQVTSVNVEQAPIGINIKY